MKLYRKSAAPHLHKDTSISAMMLDVCIALLPALLWSVYVFGLRVLVILFLSVFFCIGFEALWQFLVQQPFTLSNLSSLVSALLLTAIFPVSIPLWYVPVGAVIAMMLVKGAFGGLGKNVLNPVVTAKAILFLCFPAQLTRYTVPFHALPAFRLSFSKAYLKDLLVPSTTSSFLDESLSALFTGSTAACIGEGSAMMLLAGLVYLLMRKTISWHIPASFLTTVFLTSFLLPKEGNAFEFALRYLLSGGLVLVAVFLLTDPVTSPLTRGGKILYGVLCGVLTVFLRHMDGERGILFAILLANLSVWFLDRYLHRTYGTRFFRKRPDVIPLYVLWWKKAKALYEKALALITKITAKENTK